MGYVLQEHLKVTVDSVAVVHTISDLGVDLRKAELDRLKHGAHKSKRVLIPAK